MRVLVRTTFDLDERVDDSLCPVPVGHLLMDSPTEQLFRSIEVI